MDTANQKYNGRQQNHVHVFNVIHHKVSHKTVAHAWSFLNVERGIVFFEACQRNEQVSKFVSASCNIIVSYSTVKQ